MIEARSFRAFFLYFFNFFFDMTHKNLNTVKFPNTNILTNNTNVKSIVIFDNGYKQ